jgi:hypothetical protein
MSRHIILYFELSASLRFISLSTTILEDILPKIPCQMRNNLTVACVDKHMVIFFFFFLFYIWFFLFFFSLHIMVFYFDKLWRRDFYVISTLSLSMCVHVPCATIRLLSILLLPLASRLVICRTPSLTHLDILVFSSSSPSPAPQVDYCSVVGRS